MPGTMCAVGSCTNNLIKTKKLNLNISYHRFPKQEKTCRIWIKACNRKDQWNPNTSYICSDHFTNDNFEIDLRAELMGIPVKKRLKREGMYLIYK